MLRERVRSTTFNEGLAVAIAIDLSGRKAVVTGGGRGIGAAAARALHAAGAQVAINYPELPGDPAPDEAHALAAELETARAGSTLLAPGNVADADQVAAMMAQVSRTWGAIDILVNNAGILRDRSIAKMDASEWKSVIDVNLGGVFLCCKHGLAVMNDGGSIVNVSSLSARKGFHGQSNYAASKAGVAALTRVLARECAGRGIRVNAVAPGVIDTAMVAKVAPRAREELARAIALGRLGEPGEVAAAILFLCSPLASYVTGAVLEVDGGYL